jgi:hypothetical protein
LEGELNEESFQVPISFQIRNKISNLVKELFIPFYRNHEIWPASYSVHEPRDPARETRTIQNDNGLASAWLLASREKSSRAANFTDQNWKNSTQCFASREKSSRAANFTDQYLIFVVFFQSKQSLILSLFHFFYEHKLHWNPSKTLLNWP